MLKRIRAVEFVYHPQVGKWTCEIAFTFISARQFCDEEMAVRSAGYRWWFTAWWNARRSMKLHIAVHGAKPGERERLGWGA